MLNFSRLTPDQRLFPVEQFRKCMNKVLVNKGVEILDYGERPGYSPLRDYLADHMQQHGINVTRAEILLTNGAQQALDLLFKLLIRPGTSVTVEAPTYALVIPLLRFYNAQILPIPMNLESGWVGSPRIAIV